MPTDPPVVPTGPTEPIVAASTGVAAFVGRFETGELDVAAPVTRASEAVALFGPALADVVLFFDEADALFGRRHAHGEPDDRDGRLHTERVIGWLDAHPGALILNVQDAAVVRAAGAAIDEVVAFETRDDRADGADRPSAR